MTCLPRSGEGHAAGHLALGRMEYERAHRLQKRLHARRVAGEIPDTILTVEHDPVFTIGRSGSRDNLLVPADLLARAGIAVCEVERGGDITYHGPGQLVVYPIVDLRDHGRDLHGYIRGLEEASIRFFAEFGVAADRRHGYPGVWVGSRKIASIGVHVSQWVTRHGLALNLDVNRDHFAMIRPCGLDAETVSLSDLADDVPGLQEAAARVVGQLTSLFSWRLVPVDSGAVRAGEDV